MAADGKPPPGDSPLSVMPVRRFVLPGLFVLALFAVLIARRPDPDQTPAGPQVLQGQTMGTTFSVKIAGPPMPPEALSALAAQIHAELERVNAQMSTYRPDSELSRFNAQTTTEPFSASPELRAVVRAARSISEATDGAFDVTVGPLVDAWGFGPPGESPTPPDEGTLAALRAQVGWRQVEEEGGALRKTRGAVRVDLSAIAKGHGVDRVAAVLDAAGRADYLVEIGGEVRSRGIKAPDTPWRVGVERPDSGGAALVRAVELRDAALATSGDYRNYFERDGVRLSHTIDPRTGRPITHRLASVSVVADDCMTADAWATALNVLGPDDGPRVARAHQLEALFLVRAQGGEFQEISTPGFPAASAR